MKSKQKMKGKFSRLKQTKKEKLNASCEPRYQIKETQILD